LAQNAMELVKGIARNVLAPSAAAGQGGAEAPFVGFEIDDRTIRLDMAREQSPWPLTDGDEVIVAGQQQGGTLVGYAYKDVAQGYLGRQSSRPDLGQAALTIILAGVSLWYGATADNEIALFLWTRRIVAFALAATLVACAMAYIFNVIQKFHAAFLVRRASIATVRGVASRMETAADAESGDRIIRMELDGRPVQLVARRDLPIRDGDEVTVAGEVAGDALSVIAYRNLTRSTLGSAWSLLAMIPPILLIGLTLVVLALWWIDGDSEGLDIGTGVRWGMTVLFGLGSMVVALDCFFRWRLYREATHRVKRA
jgi:hypothetical protein